MEASIFSNLPNNLIMKIIKMNTEQEEIDKNKFLFLRCIYEIKQFSECIDREEDGVFIARYDKFDRGTKYYLSSATGKYYPSSDEDDY